MTGLYVDSIKDASNTKTLATLSSSAVTLDSSVVVPASIGGVQVFLEKYTANNGSSSKIFDLSTFTESFDEYRFVINKLTPKNDNRDLLVRLGPTTASIDIGNNYRMSGVQHYYTGSTSGNSNLSSLNAVTSVQGIGGGTGEGLSGEIKMYGLRNASVQAQTTTLLTSYYHGDSQELYALSAIHYANQDDKAVSFANDGSGNWDSGTITVYGVRNA